MRVQHDRARLYLLSKNSNATGFLKIGIRKFVKFYYKRRCSILSPRIFRHVRIFEGSGILIFRWIITILLCQFGGNSIFKVLEIAIVGYLIICSLFGSFKFSFINHSAIFQELGIAIMVNFVGLFKILLATNLQILGRPRSF